VSARGPRTQVRTARGEAMLAALPQPVFLIDGKDKIAFANGAAETFFSVSARRLAQTTLADLLSADCPLIELIGHARRRGGVAVEYGVTVAGPRLAQRVVDAQAAPLYEDKGEVVVVLQERTVAQMIGRQLNNRGAARSVSGMAAMLAHEIKNPLSGIRGAAQLLEHQLTEDDKALTRLIRDEADRIVALVDRMEAFSDTRPPPPDSVNIHDVLDHVRRLALAASPTGLTIEEVYDPSLPPLQGDRDRLIQAFLNLVKNAGEALGQRGRITLTTAYRPGMRLAPPGAKARVALPLEVCVVDDGPGISDDLKPHIFEPFVTAKTNGTGLGLALVAKVIGDHGGVIECESEPGRTVFRALLPLRSSGQRASADSLDAAAHEKSHEESLS